MMQLDKVDPKFRLLTDLLFFSDRKDIKLSEFKALFKSNYIVHRKYLWEVYLKSSKIFWSTDFWNHRFNFLLSLNIKKLSKSLEKHLIKATFESLKGLSIDIYNDVDHLQFLEFCKVKKSRKNSINNIKKHFVELTPHTNHNKLIKIVNIFTPVIFSSFEEYVHLLCKETNLKFFNLRFLTIASKTTSFNKSYIVNIFFDPVKDTKKIYNDRYKKMFFEILNDSEIKSLIKERYDQETRSFIINILKSCSFQHLHNNYCSNFKNVLYLDKTLLDELFEIYTKQLFSRNFKHKRANVDKLLKLIKFVPEITPKKVLTWMYHNNKKSDVKYFISVFPELNKLAMFA